MQYDITICIVVYNNKIKDILKIIENTIKIKLDIKIFVVDNSKENIIEKAVLQLDDNRIEYIFNNSNLGFGSANNIILDKIIKKEIVSKYHLILNADIYFDDGTIERIVKYMDEHGEVGQIGPRINDINKNLTYSCRLLPTPLNLITRRFIPLRKIDYHYEMRGFNHDEIAEVPILSGCFIFIRSNIIEKIGKFDERYFLYLEDYDLCRRISEKYKIIYYPKSIIYHAHGKGSYRNLRLLFIHTKSAIVYFNKWGWFFDKYRKEINNKFKLSNRKDIEEKKFGRIK